MKQVPILGVPIHAVSLSVALQTMHEWIAQPQSPAKLVFTPNPEMLVYAQRHPDFKSYLQHGNLNLPDGTGILWFSRGEVTERVTGTDVVQRLISSVKSLGCVLPTSGLTSKAELQVVLPEAEIIYATETFHTQPAVVLVALGSPAQEQWMINHQNLPGVRVLMGVGASLDHLTGKQRRAPLILQRFRLEWLWRLVLQPSRLKRILTATIVFPWLCLIHSRD